MDRPSTAYSCPVVDQPNPAAGSAPTVFIATPMYGGMATGTYTWSLAQTPAVFIQNGIGLLYQYRMNDALVANARNVLTHEFLETPATHLMWIDADIGFNAVDIVSMIVADQDIVCGMYPLKAIHWERVAQAVNDGVPPEELKHHVGFFVVNELDVPADSSFRRLRWTGRNRRWRYRIHARQAWGVRGFR